jgi:hypothetical protein
MHFSCKNSSKTWSNKAAPKRVVPERERTLRRHPPARAAPRHTLPYVHVEVGPQLLVRAPHPSEHIPATRSSRTRRPTARRFARRTARWPCTLACRGRTSYPQLNGRGRLRREAMPHCTLATYKNPYPFLLSRETVLHRATIGIAAPSSTPTSFRPRATPPAPPLGHRRANTTVHWPALPRRRRNSSSQRRPPPHAAERAH